MVHGIRSLSHSLIITFTLLSSRQLNASKIVLGPFENNVESTYEGLDGEYRAWKKAEITQKKKIVEEQDSIIKELANEKEEFSKNNKFNLSLIPNTWISKTLKSLAKSGNDQEAFETDSEKFDKRACRGAQLAYNLFVENIGKEYTTQKKYLLAIKNLVTFFYLHSIRPRKKNEPPLGFQEGTFVIRGKYPAFKKFFKKYRILIKKKYPTRYKSFVLPITSKKPRPENFVYDLYLCTQHKEMPLLSFKSLHITERKDYTIIKPSAFGSGSADEILASKFIYYDDSMCDHTYTKPQKILSAIPSNLITTSKLTTPFKTSELFKAVQEHKRAGFFKQSPEDFKKFIIALYTCGQNYYTCQLSQRWGNECIIGPEVLISAFFRRLSLMENSTINAALQGLFIELIEMRELYRQTICNALIPIKPYCKAAQKFSQHAAVMGQLIKDDLVKEYILNLALITRNHADKDKPLRLGLFFDLANHPTIIKDAAQRAVSQIIKREFTVPLLSLGKDIRNTPIIKTPLSIKKLLDLKEPFEHPIFSPKNGLLQVARTVAHYYKSRTLVAPMLTLLYLIHGASSSANQPTMTRISTFCSMVMKIVEEQVVPWINDIHTSFKLEPITLSQSTSLNSPSSSYNSDIGGTYSIDNQSLKPFSNKKTLSAIVISGYNSNKIPKEPLRHRSFEEIKADDNDEN